jgi:hypothetical protein
MLKSLLRASIAIGLVAAMVGGAAVAFAATTDRRPLAVISLGDSYISGEAGRWSGNSVDGSGNRGGTDRAYVAGPTGPTYDPARVYGSTHATGCHRSDVAPITHVRQGAPLTLNIACSGAVTANVLRTSAGGVGFKGEAPQNDQLTLIARAFRITAVVVSIGGNDLGFSSILTDCVLAFLNRGTPCSVTDRAQAEARLPGIRTAVGRVVDDVRATMAGAGYAPGSYRLILQSYPAAVPAPNGARYPEAGPDRQNLGGCPFLDADLRWAREGILLQLGLTLAAVAIDHGAQFLDLTAALRGHELCAATATQPTGTPDAATAEWVRWIDLAGQGNLDESYHPNAFGQAALGRCLSLMLAGPSNVFLSCVARPGQPPQSVYLSTTRD